MNVHFIAIKVSIIRATISVVHADRLLFGEDLCQMSHHAWLMESWLSIDKEDIAVCEVPVHNFLPELELFSNAISFLLRHVLEQDLMTCFFIFDHVCTWVLG